MSPTISIPGPGSPWLDRLRVLSGPLATLVAGAGLIAARRLGFERVEGLDAILVLTTAFGAVMGGIRLGLVSAGIATAAAAFALPLRGPAAASGSIAAFFVTAVACPAVAVMVGLLRGRLERSTLERERRRSEFLAEASRILASSLDYTTTLANAAQLTVPELADWCILEVGEDAGAAEDRGATPPEGAPRRHAAVAHADPDRVAMLRDARHRLRPDPESGVERVRATGRPLLVVDAGPNEIARFAADPETAAALRAVGFRSAIVAPLAASGRVFGTMFCGVGEGRPPYGSPDLAFVLDLAGRAALAVENSLLHRAEHEARRSAEAARAAAESARDRTSRLQAATSALSRAMTTQEVAETVLQQAAAALEASGGVVAVRRNGNGLRVVGSIGLPRDSSDPSAIPIELSAPLAETVRTGEPVFLASADERHARYPQLAAVESGTGAEGSAAVPLIVDFRTIGGLGVQLSSRRDFEDDRAFLLALAAQAAQALARATLFESHQRARADAEWAQRRSSFLAEASKILAASPDIEATLPQVASLAVRGLADWCIVDLFDDDRRLRRVAVAHNDASRTEIAEGLRRLDFCAGEGPCNPWRMIETGEPGVFFDLGEPDLDAVTGGGENAVLVRSLGLRSLLCLPISTGGRVRGALFLGLSNPDRRLGPADLLLAEDVARRIALAADNARLQRELRTANRTKDEFLATLSHELRSPIAGMLIWTDLLRTGDVDEAARERALQAIERGARTQAKLVDDLLDISRIIAGKLRINAGAVHLPAVISSAIDAARPLADAKSIHIERDVDRSIGPVWGDPNRLQQVLGNLLSNAIKFTQPGGRVDVRLVREDGHAEIRVTDTGKGMTAEFLPYAFDRFRQADGTPTRSHGGLGLGLAIVRHLVEVHGGTVRAESPGEGKGSTFAVRLPIPAPSEEPHPLESSLPAYSPRGSNVLDRIRVLLVDDDPDALEAYTVALRMHGGQVRPVGSVAAAKRALLESRPDVIVSDIAMPDEDGYELIRWVRAEEVAWGLRIPAVALTAFAREEDRQRAIESGFHAHLAKPIEPPHLVAAVAALVGRSGPVGRPAPDAAGAGPAPTASE